MAVASMLGWIIVLRPAVLAALLALVPPTPVSQVALESGSNPLDPRLVLLWCLELIGALFISAFLVIPWVRRQVRRRRGLCVVCGYDVRATEDNCCPECGAIRFHGAA